MTTRTGLATHGAVTTTPAGEVKLVGTNMLNRDLYLTPDKARSLARALDIEADNAETIGLYQTQRSTFKKENQ